MDKGGGKQEKGIRGMGYGVGLREKGQGIKDKGY